MERDQTVVRKKSRMEHYRMENDGSREVMVCVGAEDMYRGGGVGYEPHVHSLESNVHPTGDHDGVVGVPCVDVGTIVEETGRRRWGCDRSRCKHSRSRR